MMAFLLVWRIMGTLRLVNRCSRMTLSPAKTDSLIIICCGGGGLRVSLLTSTAQQRLTRARGVPFTYIRGMRAMQRHPYTESRC